MVYLVSVIGFIGGFILGLFMIQIFLKNKSNEELKKDKGLHWKFGLIPWVMAVLSAYCTMTLYAEFFY